MKPNLTPAETNHLRRLLGYIRCEIGQTPDEIVETLRGLSLPEPSPEAKARLLACHAKAAAVPKYVRAAVKALEKLLVKQEGVVIDVEPASAQTTELATTAEEISRAIYAAPVKPKEEIIRALQASTGWTGTAPTEPGRYLFRCMENDYEAEIVTVTRESRSGGDFLIVDCPHLGKTALPHYHDGLTEPSWKKLENEQ